MRAFVYTDPALASYAGQFAWLALNTEKSNNAAALAKYPVSAWPSMFIVDPQTEAVVLRWTGSANVEQLAKLLDDGRRALAARPSASPLSTALAEADRLYGAASYEDAAAAYEKVIGQAPSAWPELPRVADAYLFSLQMADRAASCAAAARDLLPRIAGSPSSASVAAVGLDCALSLAAGTEGRAALVAAFEQACREALADSRLGLAVDDRSGLYQELIAARREAGDAAGKKQLEQEWVALLEGAAARARTPDQRAVFDPHRVAAYLEIGEPARALPMLEASERELPEDYNPPARLAVVYRELGDYDRALAASDRALAKAYGPRRLGILRTRAQILADRGDRDSARSVLRQALAEAASLPPAQRSTYLETALTKQMESLAPATGGD